MEAGARRRPAPLVLGGFRLEESSPGEAPLEVVVRRLLYPAGRTAQQRRQRSEDLPVETGDAGEDALDRLGAEHRHGAFIQDLDPETHARVERKLPDQAEGEGIEGGDVDVGDIGTVSEDASAPRLAQFPEDAVLHLLGGLPGEGEREDVPRRHARLHQADVAAREHGCLSGAGGGAEDHVAAGIGRGLARGGVRRWRKGAGHRVTALPVRPAPRRARRSSPGGADPPGPGGPRGGSRSGRLPREARNRPAPVPPGSR